MKTSGVTKADEFEYGVQYKKGMRKKGANVMSKKWYNFTVEFNLTDEECIDIDGEVLGIGIIDVYQTVCAELDARYAGFDENEITLFEAYINVDRDKENFVITNERTFEREDK
jgi:hypothetical protein